MNIVENILAATHPRNNLSLRNWDGTVDESSIHDGILNRFRVMRWPKEEVKIDSERRGNVVCFRVQTPLTNFADGTTTGGVFEAMFVGGPLGFQLAGTANVPFLTLEGITAIRELLNS